MISNNYKQKCIQYLLLINITKFSILHKFLYVSSLKLNTQEKTISKILCSFKTITLTKSNSYF